MENYIKTFENWQLENLVHKIGQNVYIPQIFLNVYIYMGHGLSHVNFFILFLFIYLFFKYW